MGHLMGKLAEPLQQCGGSMANAWSVRRKRKRSLDSTGTTDQAWNSEAQTPKKKKLLTTTQYIYQALFKEQKNSDIAVMALGNVWNLHKVYLCQSPYFYSMFNGSWKESNQDFVHIKILDERITLEALDAVFGSMYSDEIAIDPKVVISVLATATLFHLDGIIDKCAEVMIETINVQTVNGYYEAACQYGCRNAKQATFEFLEMNLLCNYSKNQNQLREISIELMTALITSPHLYVMQTEFSLYTLLRKWMYLVLHPSYDPENPQNQSPTQQQQQSDENSAGGGAPLEISQTYFVNRTPATQSFLTTPEGQQFVKPFQALRTQYLTNHHTDLKIVLNDNIIPKEWLHSHVLSHWTSILKVDHMPEDGPQNLEPDVFYSNCMRFGRVLIEPGYQKWRWTGFNYGLDLILISDSRVLSIRRHHRAEHERLLSLQTKRQFMIRASVTSVNAHNQPTFTQTSEITSLSLEKNEEVTVMLMDTKLVHPLLISVQLLVEAPTSQKFKENLLSTEEANAIPISEIGGGATICGERETTPTNNSGSDNDSAICVVPPSPPNAILPGILNHQLLHLQAAHSPTRSSSATSSIPSMEFLIE